MLGDLLQGTAIWHPRCGPGPGQSNGNIILYLNGGNQNQGHEDKDDHLSYSAASEIQVFLFFSSFSLAPRHLTLCYVV